MVVLKVLTLNIWGLHYIAKNVNERVKLIPDELKDYDIIGLQEVWSKEDYAYFVEMLRDELPYTHYFHSGIIGSGLCVFSRHPIISAYSHQFTAGDGIYRFKTGEIFAGKGVMAVKITTPEGIITFYNTHTSGMPYQESQLFEILQFVEQTRGADPVILVGDFNTNPHHLAYSLITRCLRLRDIFIEKFCDDAFNKPRRVKKDTIDYIFISDDVATSATCCLTAQDCHATMCDPIPGRGYNLSDHDGVEAKLEVCRQENVVPSPAPRERVIDEEAAQVFARVLANIEDKKRAKHTTHRRVIFGWGGLLVLNAVLVILLSIPTVTNFLASCYLHWLPATVGIIAGALSFITVMESFHTLRLLSAYENNVKEIRSLTNFRRSYHSGRGSETDPLLS